MNSTVNDTSAMNTKSAQQLLQFITKYKNVQRILDDPFYSDPHTVRIFTDGSCFNNGYINAVGGFASIIVSGYGKNTLLYGKVNPTMLSTSITSSTKITQPTNIRAEGFAILTALNELNDNTYRDIWSDAVIYSDSEFWINMITKWMPTWTTSKFSYKSNPDIALSIRDIWRDINCLKRVSIEHVYAHNKDKRANSNNQFDRYTFHNNDLADTLASIAKDLPDYTLRRVIVDDM
jgi:ribonuclease HI